MKRQVQHTPAPRPYRYAVAVLRPPLALLTSQDWRGAEHLPTQGGFIVAVNHLSEIDPFTVAHFLVDHGYPPMFLAKSSLFDIPILGRALPKLGQVPVYRNTRRAGDALSAAEQAVNDGKCVVIMPEGTLTREPTLWPMKGRTGVGRLALATQAPVIPVGQWGPQNLLAPYARRPTGLLSQVTMGVQAGPPVDLTDLYDRPAQQSAMIEASNRVMWAITEQVAVLREEPMPTTLFDRAAAERAQTHQEQPEGNQQ
ncbi:MAG: lysophospholipid acyltransferase family protein [Ornithinimicrobium sp.]